MPCQKCLWENLSCPRCRREWCMNNIALVLGVFFSLFSLSIICSGWAFAVDAGSHIVGLPIDITIDADVESHIDASNPIIQPDEQQDIAQSLPPDTNVLQAETESAPIYSPESSALLPHVQDIFPILPDISSSPEIDTDTDTVISNDSIRQFRSTRSSSKPKQVKPTRHLLPYASYMMAQSPDGRLEPSTLVAQQYKDGGIQYCSYTARLNLEMLTGLPLREPVDTVWDVAWSPMIQLEPNFDSVTLQNTNKIIRPGDAIDIILQGLREGTLQLINPERSTIAALNILEHFHASTSMTIFDAYMHHAYMRNNTRTIAGHRFVIFLWNDDQRYVLDPTLTKTRKPILLSEYLPVHTRSSWGDNVYIDPIGYVPGAHIVPMQEWSLVMASPFDFGQFMERGFITAEYRASFATAMTRIKHITMHMPLRLVQETMFVDIASGSIFESSSDEGIYYEWRQFGRYTWSDILPWTTASTYGTLAVGDVDRPLITSKPIRVSVEISADLAEEDFELYQKIPGSFQLVATTISDSPAATCTDGIISDPNFNFQVRDGMLTFYTCQWGFVFLQRKISNFGTNYYTNIFF